MGKAYEFDEIANGVFFPIYPAIAEQIKERTGISSGRCMDLGSGGGHLGLCLAKITDMHITLLDMNEEAMEIARSRIKEWGLEENADTLQGDVHCIPVESGSVNLAISRGSLWFWEDQKKAFEEIYRILADGGVAYIGGGFANAELKRQVDKKMKLRDPEWPNSRKKFTEGHTVQRFAEILSELGISRYEITDDEKGLWIFIQK
ncbi:methyltransferase family protein [Anaerobacterium chartisolvens]|uniref:Arsenite methyltransferase n=1 Tax=Anaerobacterium chartisolvens TaxID=1297424 RepID=A0A369BI39_9FIRM|nr:class I SAM-dependent methyltransferase [Anaerobacterium chartisolvens]RCX21071.1 methyltransferase family protein [Anaerobacterium chartisolvens]